MADQRGFFDLDKRNAVIFRLLGSDFLAPSNDKRESCEVLCHLVDVIIAGANLMVFENEIRETLSVTRFADIDAAMIHEIK